MIYNKIPGSNRSAVSPWDFYRCDFVNNTYTIRYDDEYGRLDLGFVQFPEGLWASFRASCVWLGEMGKKEEKEEEENVGKKKGSAGLSRRRRGRAIHVCLYVYIHMCACVVGAGNEEGETNAGEII